MNDELLGFNAWKSRFARRCKQDWSLIWFECLVVPKILLVIVIHTVHANIICKRIFLRAKSYATCRLDMIKIASSIIVNYPNEAKRTLQNIFSYLKEEYNNINNITWTYKSIFSDHKITLRNNSVGKNPNRTSTM